MNGRDTWKKYRRRDGRVRVATLAEEQPVEASNRPWDLRATEIAARIRARTLDPVDLVESLCERIASLDPHLRAWVSIDRAGALRAAKLLRQRKELRSLPLAGLPIGLKDIFDVRGMETLAGSPILVGNVAKEDAAVVTRLRSAGAIILGKLVTSEWASADPSPTRNPWDSTRTAGGSSSGSAVAVAARMVPLSIGSQTTGSALRPATYNGVAALKPSYGILPTTGMIPHSPSLDTVSMFARDVGDLELAFNALVCTDHPRETRRYRNLTSAKPKLIIMTGGPFAESIYDSQADMSHIAERLRLAGAEVEEHALPDDLWEQIRSDHRVVNRVELGAFHKDRFRAHPDLFGHEIATRIIEGLRIRESTYVKALEGRAEAVATLSAIVGNADAVLTMATPGPAPKDLTSTGDASHQILWSHCGFPALVFPVGITMSERMPIGLQLAGTSLTDRSVIRAGVWCQSALDESGPGEMS